MARKVKDAQAAAPPVLGNLTYDTFKEHADECSHLKQVAHDANAAYRQALKRAKGAGINQAALAQALTLRRQDPEKTTTEFRDINRYLKWLGVPVGTQLGMFDDETTVATAIENDASAEEAEKAGYAAGKGGKSRSPAPYPLGTPLGAAWDAGWLRGQSDLTDEMSERSSRRMRGVSPSPQPA